MESYTEWRVVDERDGGGPSYEYLNLADALEAKGRREARWPEDGPQKVQTRQVVVGEWADFDAQD